MEVVFSHFVRRMEEIEIEFESPPRIPSLVFRGVRQLPLKLA